VRLQIPAASSPFLEQKSLPPWNYRGPLRCLKGSEEAGVLRGEEGMSEGHNSAVIDKWAKKRSWKY